jgi:DNA-binding PadR family transcriptional regulator
MTEAELTILGLVAAGSRYGHEIQRIIEERGLREWLAIGTASVYYILQRLAQQGLLDTQAYPADTNPADRMYALTEAGRGLLQTAILERLRRPRAMGVDFELGLANLSAVGPHQVYQALTQHEHDLAGRLAWAEQTWARHQQADPLPDHTRALYTHHIALMRAELAWLADFLQDWRARYPAVTASAADDEPPMNPRSDTPDPAKALQRLRRPRDSRAE